MCVFFVQEMGGGAAYLGDYILGSVFFFAFFFHLAEDVYLFHSTRMIELTSNTLKSPAGMTSNPPSSIPVVERHPDGQHMEVRQPPHEHHLLVLPQHLGGVAKSKEFFPYTKPFTFQYQALFLLPPISRFTFFPVFFSSVGMVEPSVELLRHLQ